MIRIAFKFFLNIDLTRKILLAASIIAISNSSIKKKLNNWRLSQTKSVKKKPR